MLDFIQVNGRQWFAKRGREIVGLVEEKGGKRVWEPQEQLSERERDEVQQFIMQEVLRL